MNAHRAIEIFELHVVDRTDFDDSGVIDQDVDSAETLEGLLDRSLNLRGVGQIALNGKDLGSEAIQVTFCAVELFFVAREQERLWRRERKFVARFPTQDRVSRR